MSNPYTNTISVSEKVKSRPDTKPNTRITPTVKPDTNINPAIYQSVWTGTPTATNTNIPTIIEPSVMPRVPTTIKPTTNINTKSNIYSSTPTKTDTFTYVSINPYTGKLPIMPIPNLGGMSGGRSFWGSSFKGGKRKTRYTPSLSAVALNIRGKKPAGKLTGLGFRPIISKSKNTKSVRGVL